MIKPNSLINEKSPYLLQHAYNPVNWLPWGEEAFARAQRENKPIFLSVGYSTCHWCHVMAHESFEDREIADFLNSHFVSIKVDREERPDVDRIYMAATHALTGGGGWPMSVFLLPDRTPFYAGTYFPPRAGLGRPGFLDLLQALIGAWHNDPDRIMSASRTLGDHLRSLAAAEEQGEIDPAINDTAFKQLSGIYDKKFSGFGPAPKFPRPVNFYFLLRYAYDTGNQQALDMVLQTLRRMAKGGMYDLLGGGFHRYSVDEQWRIPHFEKMLYDQAQLALTYFEAFQISADPFLRDIGTETLDYVLRDMTDAQGGFFSAEDADSTEPDDPSKHGEGAFYTWKADEIKKTLHNNEAPIFCFHYGVHESGNALADPLGEFIGKNIFYQGKSITETAAHFGLQPEEIENILSSARSKLFLARTKRPRPHLDDKIICAWNGLMISAFAKGYRVTRNPTYLSAAQRAADFILQELVEQESGTLLRRYRQGEAGLAAQLDDYAYFIQGLIDLYETSFNIVYLQKAIELTEQQILLFADEEAGGFFETTDQDATLLLRLKGDYDGAEPTANSVAALNLLRLSPFTTQDWRQRARRTIDAFSAQLNRYPTAMPMLLSARSLYLRKPAQLIISGRAEWQQTEVMIQAVHSLFLPWTSLMLADGEKGGRFMSEKIPSAAHIPQEQDKACAYVCRDLTCSLPTEDIDTLLQLIK